MTPEHKAALQELIEEVTGIKNKLDHGLLDEVRELEADSTGDESDYEQIAYANDKLNDASSYLDDVLGDLDDVLDADDEDVEDEEDFDEDLDSDLGDDDYLDGASF